MVVLCGKLVFIIGLALLISSQFFDTPYVSRPFHTVLFTYFQCRHSSYKAFQTVHLKPLINLQLSHIIQFISFNSHHWKIYNLICGLVWFLLPNKKNMKNIYLINNILKKHIYIYYYQKKQKFLRNQNCIKNWVKRFVQILLYSHLVWRSEYCAYHGDREHRPTATTRITNFSSSSENCISHTNRNRGTKMHAHHLFWPLWNYKADKYTPSSGQRWPGQHNIVGIHVVFF